MKTYSSETEHPDDELLVAFALSEAVDAAVTSHVSACAVCRKAVDDFLFVKQGIEQLPDEDVPETIDHKLLGMARHGHHPVSAHSSGWKNTGVFSLITNPYFAAFLILLMVIFFFVMINHLVVLQK